MILEKLRNLQVDRMDLDECVELCTFGRMAQDTYRAFTLPIPSFLTDAIETLSADIWTRRNDAMKARLKEIRARKTALRTREEQRAELDAEEASLTAQLEVK